MIRRPWTDAERATINAQYGTRPASEIAAELGRPLHSIYNMAHKLDRVQRRLCASDDQIVATLRELHPQGYSDSEIMATMEQRFGIAVDRHRIGEIRRRLGLASNKNSVRHRARVSAKTREQLAAAGKESLAQLRLDRWNEWKRSKGWPEHLTVRAVQAMELFYRHGALTRVQLCLMLGVDPKKRTAPISNGPGGTVLAELQRAGLITRVRKGKRIPYGTKIHDQTWGNRERKSSRNIRFKRLDVYMINPGVKPHGRKADESASVG